MKTNKVFSGKRILALILALVMAFSVMPVAFAAESDSSNSVRGITVKAPEELIVLDNVLTGSPKLTINNTTSYTMTDVTISVIGGTSVILPKTIEPGSHSYDITGIPSKGQSIYEVSYRLNSTGDVYTSYGFSYRRADTTPVSITGYRYETGAFGIGNPVQMRYTMSVNNYGVLTQTSSAAEKTAEPQAEVALYLDRSVLNANGVTNWEQLDLQYVYYEEAGKRPVKWRWDFYPEGNIGDASFGFDPQWLYTDMAEQKTEGGFDGNFTFSNYGTGNNIIYGKIPTTVNKVKAVFYIRIDNTVVGVTNYNKAKFTIDVNLVDKTALRTQIEEVLHENYQRINYTDESYTNFFYALCSANEVLSKFDSTQTQIDSAKINLEKAVADLKYPKADYTALEEVKSNAKAILDDEKVDETYTVESLALLREKYDAALQLPADLDVRQQAQVDKAASDLTDAINALVKFADYSELQMAVIAFNALNPKHYDAEDFAAVKTLADEAKEALKPENRLPESEQATVNAMADELFLAVMSLKKLPANYDAFDAAVLLAKTKLESSEIQNYTAISVKALEDAYLASANVERDKDITYQETIDAATQAITDALAGLTLKGADYTKLDAAIAAAEAELKRSDIADFTEASVQVLKDALAAAKGVSRELTVDQQNVIDEARDALAAATHLVLKDADYSALDAAIEARETELADARESGKFTDASMTRLEIAIGAAKDVDRTYSIKEQSKIDDAVKALNSVKLEKKAADTAALEAAIAKAQDELNKAGDEYTDESKTAMAEAIKKAREVLATYGGDVDNQAIIDKAVTDLEAVKLQLKKADYTELDAAIEAAEKFLADSKTEELYTPEAIQKVKDALEAANVVDRDLTIKEQKVVDDATDALVNAMPGDSDYKDANLEALVAAIAAADEKLNKEDIADYTEESVAALKAARDDAQAMVDRKPNVTEQDDVNAKAAALNSMELTLKGADYSALEAAVAKATSDYAKAEASGLYTESSLEKLMAAIVSANALLDNRNLTVKEQDIVDNAAEALKVELVYKNADLTELIKAIAAAEAKIAAPGYGDYTLASRQAFEALLDEAKVLCDSNPDITKQDDVIAAAEKLNNFKLSLQGADYTALDEIIAEAKALLETNLSDKYTNVSIDVMKAALTEAENIDRELDVSDQGYIDDIAQALRNAIDALNPYNKVTDVQITQNGQVVDGDVAYVKVPWYKTYKSQSTVLGISVNSDDIASVKWELANWSIDNPEADIIDNGDGTVTIKPNGKGIGARSCWVKVTVTDINGNTVEDVVKVRFYNWDWQK